MSNHLLFNKDLEWKRLYFMARCYRPSVKEYKLGFNTTLVAFPVLLNKEDESRCNVFIFTLSLILLQFQFSFTFNHKP